MEAFARSESVNLRPLALPTEHGGWGILLEPVALGLLVAPSWSGGMIAIAALFAFLARQPLKLALQDALRGRSYPRTSWCWMFAMSYATVASLACASAVMSAGWRFVLPFALVSPLALVMLIHDARNRSRGFLPEMAGAVAMASLAAAIPLAGGRTALFAATFMALILLRSLPSIIYVRTLLGRGSKPFVLALHLAAIAVAAWIASPFAIAAFGMLLARAVWGLTHATPRPQTVGWREIAYGAVTILLFAM